MSITLYSSHMTLEHQMKGIAQTHLGQAHFAGTGPEGKTCRECTKWCTEAKKDQRRYHRYLRQDPQDKKSLMELQSHRCHHRIMNKASDVIPPCAGACKYFEQSATPPQWSARLCVNPRRMRINDDPKDKILVVVEMEMATLNLNLCYVAR